MQLETWVDLLLIITFLYFSLYPFESPEIKCKENYDEIFISLWYEHEMVTYTLFLF